MTVRGVDPAVVGGGTALGAAVLTVSVAAAGDSPPLVWCRLGLLALVVAAAAVLDEPAAAVVDAAPRTRRRRTVDRLPVLALAVGVWAAGVGALELRVPATPGAALLVEGVGALAVAVAMAAVLRRLGRPEPGEQVATGLGAALLALLLFEPPGWWPAPFFPDSDGWHASTWLWAVLAVGAAGLVVLASADPARRLRR